MKKFEYLDLLNEMVAKRYISVQKHPNLPLFIYKYAISTPYEKMWNKATLAARGLVLDKDGYQYNTPFYKFFNIEELESIGLSIPDNTSYKIYKKIDGSLIQALIYNDEIVYTSSGSLDSIFSILGKKISIDKGYDKLIKDFYNKNFKNNTNIDGLTFIFELLHPKNRIVVNNGDVTDLILLGVRYYDDIASYDYNIYDSEFNKFNIVPEIKMTWSDLLKEKHRSDFINQEGFVVLFDNGFRVKVKYEEYFKLHKLMSNVNEKFVWELVSSGKNINDIGDNIPDETFSYIKDMQTNLITKFTNIKEDANKCLLNIINILKDKYNISNININDIKSSIDRKKYSIEVGNPEYKKYSAILYHIYDNKEYSHIIWNMIKPKFSQGENAFNSLNLTLE